MDRDRPGVNRDIGNPSDVRRQNLPDYSPCEAADAVNKYARYVEGASVVILSARDAVASIRSMRSPRFGSRSKPRLR